jgi:hypothetical protein
VANRLTSLGGEPFRDDALVNGDAPTLLNVYLQPDDISPALDRLASRMSKVDLRRVGGDVTSPYTEEIHSRTRS